MGNQVSVDLGPVYVEIVVFLPEEPNPSFSSLNIYSEEYSGTFYFFRYNKKNIEQFKEHPIFQKIQPSDFPVPVTGMRYDSFQNYIQESFQVPVTTHEQMPSATAALHYLTKSNNFGFYSYVRKPPNLQGLHFKASDFKYSPLPPQPEIYPCILINIRSGISLYRVNSPTEFLKVGGSSLGGSTVWALLKMTCNYEDPVEALQDALNGDHSLVDMTVKDIYGGAYQVLGLPADVIASSCAKLRETSHTNHNPADVAKSVLLLFLFNSTQLAYMQAQVEGIQNVVVIGNALHLPSLNMLAEVCMQFWSKGSLKLIHSEYGAYLAAFGSLLKHKNNI